jgi:hypothetical protein
MPIYYKVVKGSVGDISRFETDVATFLASGFIPVGGIAINGTDMYQSLARNTEVDPNMYPSNTGPPNPSRQQRPGAMMQSAPSTTPR